MSSAIQIITAGGVPGALALTALIIQRVDTRGRGLGTSSEKSSRRYRGWDAWRVGVSHIGPLGLMWLFVVSSLGGTEDVIRAMVDSLGDLVGVLEPTGGEGRSLREPRAEVLSTS